ncbi:MAG TPA: hypothetical protein VF349_03405 [Candidatus Limnocylindrales bacterium]
MNSESRGALRGATAHRAANSPCFANAPRAVAALLAVVVIGVAACGISPPTAAPPAYTAVPIGPTVWPSGTVGRYGLRIDPSLLGKLPASVGALALVENPGIESQVLDDLDLANSFDGYAAATIGSLGDPDWLYVAIGRLKPDKQNNADFYTAWVEEYATGACSQAGGVAPNAGQQTINERLVDVSTCNGGPVVYTLSLGNGLLLSMYGLGPRDLGRKLIETLH